MAHIEMTDSEENPIIYNVTMAVGQWCANRCDDVLLVQYMLRKIYSRPMQDVVPPSRPLAVDGSCGRVTVEYIHNFQEAISNGSAPIKVDGRVDPMRGRMSEITHTIYTIYFINKVFKDHFYSGDFADFPNDPDVPAILRGSLGGSQRAMGVTD